MRGAIPALPKHVLVAWSFVKHRDSFTFPSERKDKSSEQNISKHSLNLMCSSCLREWNFDFLLSPSKYMDFITLSKVLLAVTEL
jgi:hypothetical protein